MVIRIVIMILLILIFHDSFTFVQRRSLDQPSKKVAPKKIEKSNADFVVQIQQNIIAFGSSVNISTAKCRM